MIVGDKSRFAIEFELDPARQTDIDLAFWMIGHIQWWCGGQSIGLYGEDETIRDVAVGVGRFLKFEGQRHDPELVNASPGDVISTVKAALFEDRGQSDEQVEADARRYLRFWVGPQVDVFDGWDIVLVEDGQLGRLIWRRDGQSETHECKLAAGEFGAVAREFLEALGDPRLLP